MAYKRYLVTPQEEGARLVNYLKIKTQSSLSLKKIKKALEKGICRLNGKTECFASIILKEGDKVEIEISGLDSPLSANQTEAETQLPSQEDSPHSKHKSTSPYTPKVLFEDDYFLMIDKPIDLLSSDPEMQKYFPNTLLVHRLDAKTSGLLILAKNKKVKESFISIFSKQEIKKTYLAIVDGHFDKQKGKITSFLKPRKSAGKILFKSHPKIGQKAVTAFETLHADANYSSVLFYPLTGRTHQIRVHALELGHPVLGDYHYSQDFKYPHFVDRLLLHSWQVEFIHPFTKKRLKVKAPIPESFKKYLKHAHLNR